ncbi:MAG: hypothetical protein U5J78_08050 [Parasphingorhabdus sp.]|nr:hypothetical protein [Parasphingorhabdus sp.]
MMQNVYFIVSLLSYLFILLIGMLIVGAIILFVIDKSQHEDAIRHNYPVIGRFRKIFSDLGDFFRQYFFAMDREEMPFNRAEREWVERATTGGDRTAPHLDRARTSTGWGRRFS